MSDVHLIIVPTRDISDITRLTSADTALLLHMADVARRQLRYDRADIDAVVGFNFPVSVHHLHLHVALPPFKHRRVCEVDRWYNLTHCVDELRVRGRVRLWSEWESESLPIRQRQHEIAVSRVSPARS